MLQRILQASARLRLLMMFLAAVAIFVGLNQQRNMPVDVLPEFSEPYVEVQTEALGLSAIEVEQLITVPLEADLLNGVAWLKTIRSRSIPGLSSVLLFFEPGTDVLRARQMVQERLTQAVGLPHVSKPSVMLQPLSSTNRVMHIGLTARDISDIDMSVLTRWTIRPRLLGVTGVANVSVWGLRNRQLQVQVDPKRLREAGVTLNQVIKTAGDALWISPLTFLEASTPGTGGWVDTPNQRLGIRHLMPITSSEQLAKVALAEKAMVALEDVANVVEDHQPLIGDAIVNDAPGLMLVIEKFPWANTLEVTRGVEQAVNDMRPGLAGIDIDSTLFRPASYIELSLQNLAWSLPLGGVFMVVALFAFLYSWRFAVIGLVAIVVSIMAAALVLHLRGVTINMMILAGLALALGVVVDDAVVDTQNIARRLRLRRSGDEGKSPSRIVIEALGETRGTLVYATLILLLAVGPLFFLQGLSGSFLRPLAFAYVLAILASMVVALTVTPALSVTLIREESSAPARQSPLSEAVRGLVERAASRVLSIPSSAFVTLALLLAVGVAASFLLGRQSLLPSLKENDLLVEWEGSPGTSRPAMSRSLANASRELRTIPGVRNVSAHLGRAILSDEIVDVNSSEIWVSIDTGADYDATVARVREVVDGYPGLRREVLTFLKERTGEAAADDEIVVRVYGHDLAILRDMAGAVQKSLASVQGVVDARIEEQVERPSLEIKPDLAKVMNHGLKPGDVRRAAATLLSGLEVGYIFEEQKVFDVVVWGTPETRHSVSSVSELLIDTPAGQHVSLSDVADMRVTPVPMVIEREGVARYIDVTANVSGRGLGSVAADVDRAIKEMKFPLEYHAEVLGDYAERQAAGWRVLNFAIAAAVGIFMLLQAAFGSWRLAAIAFLSLPAALAGGVLAALPVGAASLVGSLAGLLAVLSIATRNSLMLIRHFQRLEHEEGQSFGIDLVLRGIGERSGPIVATAVTVAVAVIPLVVLGDIAGQEILHPMSVVILGGLLTTLLVDLVIVPALYLRFGAGTKPEMFLTEMNTEAKLDAVR